MYAYIYTVYMEYTVCVCVCMYVCILQFNITVFYFNVFYSVFFPVMVNISYRGKFSFLVQNPTFHLLTTHDSVLKGSYYAFSLFEF